MIVVGLDCASNPKHVGLARAAWTTDAGLSVAEARVASSAEDIIDTIVAWLGADRAGLLAIDAPLGWPAPLAAALSDHAAGGSVAPEANAMFRRRTDHLIKQRVGKLPLDVGADRIARTAHAALRILEQVRRHLDVRLAWRSGPFEGYRAIEVYPAATLKTRGARSSGYKGAERRAQREEIIEALALQLPDATRAGAEATDHVLDAILCVVAGEDFLTGAAVPPDDIPLAKREGWIWAR